MPTFFASRPTSLLALVLILLAMSPTAQAQSLFSDGTPYSRSRAFDRYGEASRFDPQTDGEFTVELWVYGRGLPGLNQSGLLVGRPTAAPEPGAPSGVSSGLAVWSVRYNSTGNDGEAPYVVFEITDGQEGGEVVQAEAQFVISEGWHHVAAVYTGTDLRLFIDGEEKSTASISFTPPSGSVGLYAGGFNVDNFAGYIDDLALWSTALSNETISAHAASSLTGQEEDLLALWDFNAPNVDDDFDDVTGASAPMQPSFGSRPANFDRTSAGSPTAAPVANLLISNREAVAGSSPFSIVVSADPPPVATASTWDGDSQHLSLASPSEYNAVTNTIVVDVAVGAALGGNSLDITLEDGSGNSQWASETITDIPVVVQGVASGQQDVASGPITVTMYNDARVGRDHDAELGGRLGFSDDEQSGADGHPLFSGALVFLTGGENAQHFGQLYSGPAEPLIRSSGITPVQGGGLQKTLFAAVETGGECDLSNAVVITETVSAPSTNSEPWIGYQYSVQNNGCKDIHEAYVLWELDFDIAEDINDAFTCDLNRHLGMSFPSVEDASRISAGVFGQSPEHNFVCGAYVNGDNPYERVRSIASGDPSDPALSGDLRLVVGYGPLFIPANNAAEVSMALGLEGGAFPDFAVTRAEGQPQVGSATFRVDMSLPIEIGAFDPNTDEVHLQSTIHGWETNDGLRMASVDPGSPIYERAVDGIDMPVFIYKYRTTAPDAPEGGYETLGQAFFDEYGAPIRPVLLGDSFETQRSGYFNRMVFAGPPDIGPLQFQDEFSTHVTASNLWDLAENGFSGFVGLGGITSVPDGEELVYESFLFDDRVGEAVRMRRIEFGAAGSSALAANEDVFIVGRLSPSASGAPVVEVIQMQPFGQNADVQLPRPNTISAADITPYPPSLDRALVYQRVRIEGVTLIDPNQWPTTPGGAVVQAQVDDTPFEINIRRGVSEWDGTLAPDGAFTISGILEPYTDSGSEGQFRLHAYEIMPALAGMQLDSRLHLEDEALWVPLRIDNLGSLGAIGMEFTIASTSDFASLDEVHPGPAIVDDFGNSHSGEIFLTTATGSGIRVGIAGSTPLGAHGDVIAYLEVNATDVGTPNFQLTETWLDNIQGALDLDRGSNLEIYVDYGDVDRNGMLRAYDAAILLQSLVDIGPPLTRTQEVIANVDGSSDESGARTLTAADATAILRTLLGIDPCFYVEGCQAKSTATPAQILAASGVIERFEQTYRIPLEIRAQAHGVSALDIRLENLAGARITDVSGIPSSWLSAVGPEAVALAGAVPTTETIALTISVQAADDVAWDQLEISITPDGFTPHRVAAQALELPTHLALESLFPSPFGARATLDVATPETAALDIALFDVLGRRVHTVESGTFGAGVHRFSIDGSALPAGLYILRVSDGKTSITRSLVHL